MDRVELLGQLELYLSLLSNCRYSDRITFTSKSAEEIVHYGIDLGIIENRKHPLGDIVAIAPKQAVLLTYFRNNVSHLVAVPSLIASCFLNRNRIELGQLHRITQSLYPFLKAELFLPWDGEEFKQAVDDDIAWLLKQGLLSKDEKNNALRCPKSGGHKDQQLRIMGHTLLQTFERYFITVAILDCNRSGTLTRSELERLCYLTAQRMSQLNEFAAPEFSDRNLFRQFIALLRDEGIITTNADEKLEFNKRIQQISNDAKFILSKDIRHGILRVAPQVLMHPDQE
jgi:glycerol-3-phosphate O-acyltransferase